MKNYGLLFHWRKVVQSCKLTQIQMRSASDIDMKCDNLRIHKWRSPFECKQRTNDRINGKDYISIADRHSSSWKTDLAINSVRHVIFWKYPMRKRTCVVPLENIEDVDGCSICLKLYFGLDTIGETWRYNTLIILNLYVPNCLLQDLGSFSRTSDSHPENDIVEEGQLFCTTTILWCTLYYTE